MIWWRSLFVLICSELNTTRRRSLKWKKIWERIHEDVVQLKIGSRKRIKEYRKGSEFISLHIPSTSYIFHLTPHTPPHAYANWTLADLICMGVFRDPVVHLLPNHRIFVWMERLDVSHQWQNYSSMSKANQTKLNLHQQNKDLMISISFIFFEPSAPPHQLWIPFLRQIELMV